MKNLQDHQIDELSHSHDGQPHDAKIWIRDGELRIQPYNWDDTLILIPIESCKTDLIITL